MLPKTKLPRPTCDKWSNGKTFSEFLGRVPFNVVEVAGVEMRLLQVLLVARPDHRQAHSRCVASLKVHAVLVFRYVGHDKPTLLNAGDYLEHNVSEEFLAVYPNRVVSCVRFNGGLDRLLPSRCQRRCVFALT